MTDPRKPLIEENLTALPASQTAIQTPNTAASTMNHWIDDNQQLAALCAQLQTSSSLAIDTEFMRTDTYFPKLALIQLSDGEQCWLIDVLAIDQFAPLKNLLEAPG